MAHYGRDRIQRQEEIAKILKGFQWLSSLSARRQNTKIRTPNVIQDIESHKNHRGGIAVTNPVIAHVRPTNTAAKAENGTKVGYFMG